MKHFLTFAAFAALALPVHAVSFEDMFPGHPGYEYDEVNAALQSMNYRQGLIVLPGGQAELQVPEGYYYLNAEDAETVLTFLWQNPASDRGLGMIFPADVTPWDQAAWGVELRFEGIGYVSDEDAETIDYASLLVDMQADARAASRNREEQGYQPFELIGWAEPPSYDSATRKLHWAQELHFDGSETNTLNYELRALGREGVLSANFIATMAQLPQVKDALPEVSAMIAFVPGKTYAEFDPSVDKVAAVGIAGLIAGKVLTSKAGLMAAGLLLLKKFWFVLLLPIFWLKTLFRRNS